MRTRLALIVLLFVILPTAVLSFMATQALRHWEFILQRRVEAGARAAIDSVSNRMKARLGDELEQVRNVMFDCLVRGGRFKDIESAAVRVRDAHPLVSQVYLFMNPWGFVYPEQSAPAEVALRDELRRAIAASRTPHLTLPLRLADASYGFAVLGEGKGLYAGLRVDPATFRRQLDEALAMESGGGLTLSVAEDDARLRSEARPGQAPSLPPQVTSRSENDEASPIGGDAGGPVGQLVARSALAEPFGHVRIVARSHNVEAMRRAGASRVRLYGWSILLMTAGIVVGAWTVFKAAATEIQKARARSDYVAGVSHDLRTPVASMKMLAESLYLGHVRTEDKQKRFLSTIVRECDRLTQLIERVLFFVRFGQHALVFNRQEVDPEEMVGKAVGLFNARHTSTVPGGPAPVHVRLESAAGLPAVKVDAAALAQVVLNLLDNAAKYSAVKDVGSAESPQSHRIDVRLTTEERGWRWPWQSRHWVRISVRDYGVGIGPEDLKRIFTQFYRTTGARRRNVSGVGLGLAVCRHVVSAHHGRIHVESDEGRGSTFSVLLPAGRQRQHPGAAV